VIETVLKRRCAVYTRKSTDEGLDMAFNSLDAQREACEAYVASQRGEGWMLVADHYDGGGFSGGTLERPALKRLLADIQAGKIDCVVVYKIDRLTRALMDFSKLVDLFEKHSVTFVSVTQSFNTTTSMGRLTLNMLLSCAQFERELGSERVRDKIAASKRRGLWTGSGMPLGYKIENKQLIIEPVEAALVQRIFQRYVTLRSITRSCASWTPMASASAPAGPSTRSCCTRS
jgi:DNA invertase Pin-like site-specific DNA recombinase